jgi:L-lactate dehydrogenase complex protein LldF
VKPASRQFHANAGAALADEQLQAALGRLRAGFPAARRRAIDALPGFDALRDRAVAIKNETLASLGEHLQRLEEQVVRRGGQVHWCRTAAEACETVEHICRQAGARLAVKSKSMTTEEIGLNEHLEKRGLAVVETDLGEYILQLRHETPTHIVAPAIHLNRAQIAQTFRDHHDGAPTDRDLSRPELLVQEARRRLRQDFLRADVGITGANVLVAETGSVLIATNEGNADLAMTLPRVHIAVAGIEKVVPTLDDAFVLIRLLARSATGQGITAYTTLATGPRRDGDPDGPDAFHLVLVDNGRSALVGTEMQDVLRCIRCGACMNDCPVYTHVGGKAYGFVYPGPIGAALDPALIGLDEASALPHASTFCGRCEEVCPVRIPLPRLMRHWREKDFAAAPPTRISNWALALWAFMARRPTLYRWASAVGIGMIGRLGRRRGRFSWFPFADAWTADRDLPAPQTTTFQSLWAERNGTQGR